MLAIQSDTFVDYTNNACITSLTNLTMIIYGQSSRLGCKLCVFVYTLCLPGIRNKFEIWQCLRFKLNISRRFTRNTFACDFLLSSYTLYDLKKKCI